MQKSPAVLLDVDGVLVRLVDRDGDFGVSPRTEAEIVVFADLGNALDALQERKFVIVAITNQPDIARGKIEPAFLDRKHELLKEAYPQIEEVFVCPHTESDLCECRKPKPGLLLKAAKKFNLDLSTVWMVGDSRADIEAGNLVHAKTVLVQNRYNCGDPSIAICTAVAKSTRRALSLIVAVHDGKLNSNDI